MKKIVLDNGNGEKKAISLTSLIITLLVLLFGTNLIGSFISSALKSAAMAKDIALVQTQVEKNTDAIVQNTKGVTILRVKLEALDKGQDEIKQLIMKNNK